MYKFLRIKVSISLILSWRNSLKVMITSISNKGTNHFSRRLFSVKNVQSPFMSNVIRLVRDDSKYDSESVQFAANLLREGDIIAIPTDTVYGIAADAQNTSAINKLYEVKKRAPFKPLAICLSDPEDVENWCEIDSSFPKTLLSALLPGPVTLVFRRNTLLNPNLNPGISCVGIRVPDHPFIRAVAKNLGSPIALTSANISSEKASIATHEFSDMWSSLSVVFDGGCLAEGKSKTDRLGSTVVDLSNTGCFRIIRDGCALLQTVAILKEHGLFEEKL